MPRIRAVFPAQWTDEDFVALSLAARLLTIAIRNHADDHGCFEWKPIALKMKVFPGDSFDVEPLLAEMVDNDICQCFTVAGRRYGVIRNFCKFQRPKKPSYQYPFPAALRVYVGIDKAADDDTGQALALDLSDISSEPLPRLTNGSTELNGHSHHASSVPVPNQSGNLSAEVGGRRQEVGGSSDLAHPDGENRGDGSALKRATCVRFAEFWDVAYPHRGGRKKGRKTAEAKYAAAVKRGVSETTIIAGAMAAKSDPDVIRGFARDPTTWLTAEGWADEFSQARSSQPTPRLGAQEEIW
jgi:hypothetical protein